MSYTLTRSIVVSCYGFSRYGWVPNALHVVRRSHPRDNGGDTEKPDPATLGLKYPVRFLCFGVQREVILQFEPFASDGTLQIIPAQGDGL